MSMEKDSESSSDALRVEERWSDSNEKFILNLRDQCDVLSEKHSNLSRKNKYRNLGLSIPCFVVPLILSGVTPFVVGMVYVNTIGMTSVGILSGINAKMNYGHLQELHNTYACKYADLSMEINKIMVRKKRYRECFDIILERITNQKRHLDDSAPDI